MPKCGFKRLLDLLPHLVSCFICYPPPFPICPLPLTLCSIYILFAVPASRPSSLLTLCLCKHSSFARMPFPLPSPLPSTSTLIANCCWLVVFRIHIIFLMKTSLALRDKTRYHSYMLPQHLRECLVYFIDKQQLCWH